MPGRRNNASRLVDIVAAGGRYDILVQRQEARLFCTVITKWCFF
jgi:histidyl-tRNA synthetase